MVYAARFGERTLVPRPYLLSPPLWARCDSYIACFSQGLASFLSHSPVPLAEQQSQPSSVFGLWSPQS